MGDNIPSSKDKNSRAKGIKTLSFRFDVDTHLCLREGLPNINDLGTETNQKFTFYINMGKAVSLVSSLTKIFHSQQNIKKLSSFKKLGACGYLEALLFNPLVGSSSLTILNDLIHNGHELGLHGGKNHGTWLHQSHRWNKERFRDEILWGYKQLSQTNVGKIHGFASPGWLGSQKAYQVLANLGFEYIADDHDPYCTDLIKEKEFNLKHINTNLIGEPGGVGYLEFCRAKGYSDAKILSEIDSQLNKNNHSIIYDHPVYAGRFEIPLLRKIIQHVQSKNILICTINHLIQIYPQHNR